MENKTNDKRSVLMFVSAMLIFGTVGIFRKYIPCSSAFLAFARGIIGGLFLLVYTRLSGKQIKEKLPAGKVIWLAATGAVMGINWILLFEAYNHTTVAVATLCYYMQPTIVMLASPFIFGEKLTFRKLLCAVMAVFGMVLVSGVFENSMQAENMKGIMLGLGAAVFYAGVIIMNKKLPGIDAWQKTVIQLFSAGLAMVPYMLMNGSFQIGGLSLSALLMLAAVGIIHTGIAYVLYFGSMDGLRAQSIAIFSYIDPVSALLFSALILKEPLSAMNLIGAVLIIGSALLSELHK